MHAYAPDGTPIVATKDLIPGSARIVEGGFAIGANGLLDCEQDGTDVHWNDQRTVVVRGQQIVVDENDAQWPVCAVVALDEPPGEDDDGEPLPLPADLVAAARARLAEWRASARPAAADPAPVATEVVDLVATRTATLALKGIAWDVSSDDAPAPDLAPLLPFDLTVRVPEDVDLENGSVADLLSDRYGFCVSSIGSIERVQG